MMIRISHRLSIEDHEVEITYVRASGPGGQNVNKVSTAVQLRFDIRHSPSLSQPIKERLAKLAGQRLTSEGVLVLFAQRFRSQELNRKDAMERLITLIRDASIVPITRRPTKPTLGSKQRRMDQKTHRSGIKSMRGSPKGDE